MPILDLQRNLRRLGKIRMGHQAESQNGKKYPAKLNNWRFTSPSPELIEAAAGVYGGEPHTWQAPDGEQWEVFTDSPTVRVLIPPTVERDVPADDGVFSQNYELWSAGGCQRRCDGYTEHIGGVPCVCSAAGQEADDRDCKATTRLSVMLPDLPDLGTWMMESHGYYATVELGGAMELVRRMSGGAIVPAALRIEPRSVVREGKTKRFIVPVLELTGVRVGELASASPVEIARPATPAPALPVAGRAEPAAVQSPPRVQPPLPHEIESGPAVEPSVSGPVCVRCGGSLAGAPVMKDGGGWAHKPACPGSGGGEAPSGDGGGVAPDVAVSPPPPDLPSSEGGTPDAASDAVSTSPAKGEPQREHGADDLDVGGHREPDDPPVSAGGDSGAVPVSRGQLDRMFGLAGRAWPDASTDERRQLRLRAARACGFDVSSWSRLSVDQADVVEDLVGRLADGSWELHLRASGEWVCRRKPGATSGEAA